MRQQQPTTITILDTSTLVTSILARLLREEGYNTRLLGAYPTGLVDELLDGVDVLLLNPNLDAEARRAFVGNMRSTPKAAAIPVLSRTLLAESAAILSWHSPLRELVRQIGAAPARATASARAPVVNAGGTPASAL